MELVDSDSTQTSTTAESARKERLAEAGVEGAKALEEYTWLLKKFDDGVEGWCKHLAVLKAHDEQLTAALKEVEEEIGTAQAVLDKAMEDAGEGVGGSIVMVDLAGADYDGRNLGEGVTKVVVGGGAGGGAASGPPAANSFIQVTKKESADINKSLLALKECLRSIAGAKGAPKKAPFRSSNLTRLLEDALLPGALSTRRNRKSNSVMVVCAGPGDRQEKMTVNALRYGQLVSKDGGGKAGGGKGAGGGGAAFISGAGKRPEKPWLKQKPKDSSDVN